MTGLRDTNRPRVALVLGAAVWPGGEPSPSLRRRALHAAALYRDGKVDAIVGCGGVGRNPPAEGAVIAALCRDAGVPDAALHVEDRSTTTRENIANALPILQRLNPREAIIVTDAYHAPRARLVARQLGLAARSDCPDWRGPGTWQWLRQTPREAMAILAALFRLR